MIFVYGVMGALTLCVIALMVIVVTDFVRDVKRCYGKGNKQ